MEATLFQRRQWNDGNDGMTMEKPSDIFDPASFCGMPEFPFCFFFPLCFLILYVLQKDTVFGVSSSSGMGNWRVRLGLFVLVVFFQMLRFQVSSSMCFRICIAEVAEPVHGHGINPS